MDTRKWGKMDMIEALVKKLRSVIDKDDRGLYVTGSGLVWVHNARAHQIPNVIAERHREDAERELLRGLIRP